MRQTGLKGAGAAIACGLAAPAAAGTMPDPRLPRLAMPARAPRPVIVAAVAPVAAWLGVGDRSAPRSARTRSYSASLGAVGISFDASRFRAGRAAPAALAAATDRYAGQSAGARIAIPLLPGTTIGTDVSITRLKRRSAIVADGFRPRATVMTAVGALLAREGGPALRLDWNRTSLRRVATPGERLAELAGGAPAAERGVRLSFLGTADEGDRGRPQWRVALSAMRRDAGDFALPPSSGTFADRRVEAGLRVPL